MRPLSWSKGASTGKRGGFARGDPPEFGHVHDDRNARFAPDPGHAEHEIEAGGRDPHGLRSATLASARVRPRAPFSSFVM
jgi:hypothetical protein